MLTGLLWDPRVGNVYMTLHEMFAIYIFHFTCCFFQEHLAVMGIPAFQCLAQHTPYPPFDVDGLSPGIQKKIAGNDS